MILIRTPKYKLMERKIALDILLKWKKENSYLNLTINAYFQKYDLSRQEKDFITRVVYGTVQNYLFLEYVLKQYCQGRVKSFEKMLLVMSLYQHYYMKSIPDYAIVNEAVNIAKKQKGIKTSQFVNAILKKALSTDIDLSSLDELERLSIETSHPLWMVKMFTKQYGFEETKKICQANNEVPYKTARMNTLKASADMFSDDSKWQKGQFAPTALYYQGGNIAHSQEYQEGLVTIQDESSQMVASLLNPNSHDYVLDMCCAPGGKTTHLAAIMNNGGQIDAFDLYEHKVHLVDENCQRLGVTNVKCQAYDATKLSELYDNETFDKILLDAPCSGFGVLSRKPEIKYHDSQAMDEIIQIQYILLNQAYLLLKKDGQIVYSTCTINKKENEKQIQRFIQEHPDMVVAEEKTILPYMYHSDGFYMCLLKKEGKNEINL